LAKQLPEIKDPKTYGSQKAKLSCYYIKDTFLEIFYDFISELNKIPSTDEKKAYLQKVLYRNAVVFCELNSVISYYIKRLIMSPPLETKFLPLDTLEEVYSENKTGKKINMPELDFMINYGVLEKELRPYFEDYIYTEKGLLQKFLCNYINGDNIFKIPKENLKELWTNKRLMLEQVQTMNSIKKLHANFLKKYDSKRLAKVLDLKNHNKFNNIVIPEPKEIEALYRKWGLKARNIEKARKITNRWKTFINDYEPVDTKFKLNYPCILYKGNESKKAKLIYFCRYGGVVRTNIEGYLYNYFETVFKRQFARRLAFIGYLNPDNSISVLIANEDKDLCKSFLMQRAFKIQYNLPTLRKSFKRFKQNMDFYKETFGVTKIKLHKQSAKIFSSLHYVLNFILLHTTNKKDTPFIVMFRNFVILNNGVNVRKAIMTHCNNSHRMAEFTYLDTKEKFKLNYSRLSESFEVVPNFLNEEVHIFDFERGAKFALLSLMKKFTFSEEEYNTKVTKLRHYDNIINYNFEEED